MNRLPYRPDDLAGQWPAPPPTADSAAAPPARSTVGPSHPGGSLMRPPPHVRVAIGLALAVSVGALALVALRASPEVSRNTAGSRSASVAGPGAGAASAIDVGAHVWGAWHGSTSTPADVRAAIARGRLGGVLLFADDVAAPTPAAYRSLARRFRAIARRHGRAAPIVAVDQGTGAVPRAGAPAPEGAGGHGKDWWSHFEIARRTGALLRRSGIDVDLAPVADVAAGPASVAAGRGFATSPEHAAMAVSAVVAGLGESGIAATAKHFPGLGAATASTDVVPVTVDAPPAELRAAWRPFTAAIASGVELVMLSTATFPALDAVRPAALSPLVVGALRRELGFDGVCVTDALDTPALDGSPGRRAVAALAAGCDIVLFAESAGGGAYDAVTAALADGRLSSSALRRSDRRLRRLRDSIARRR